MLGCTYLVQDIWVWSGTNGRSLGLNVSVPSDRSSTLHPINLHRILWLSVVSLLWNLGRQSYLFPCLG